MDNKTLFLELHPGFFDKQHEKDTVFSEMLLNLKDFNRRDLKYPADAKYGIYTESLEKMKEAVRSVIPHWEKYFTSDKRIYCCKMNNEIASFCMIEDLGLHEYNGLKKIGAPACIGTVEKFRRHGIGLKLVQDVTGILKNEGYDISYIHYTSIPEWYSKLGYNEIIKWDNNGIISERR